MAFLTEVDLKQVILFLKNKHKKYAIRVENLSLRWGSPVSSYEGEFFPRLLLSHKERTLQEPTWRVLEVAFIILLFLLYNGILVSFHVSSESHPVLHQIEMNNCAGSEKGEASAPLEENGSEAPSAPEDTDPSAPVETFQSAECVVCLERKVTFQIYIFSLHLFQSLFVWTDVQCISLFSV